MARVLILSLVFPPDGVSTAQLMGELAQDLAAGGHDVSVVTTVPHYNRDRDAEEFQPLTRIACSVVRRSVFHDIPVFHVPMPADRSTVLGRLRGWLSFHILGFYAALRHTPRPDVILVPSPLLTAAVVAWAINLVRGGCYIYNVQELYPDLAVQMGRLRNPSALGALKWLERFVYGRAGAVTAISHGIYEQVAKRGIDTDRLHLIPNFVDTTEIRPQARRSEFAIEWGLEDTFNVSYAGNMGYAQGLDTVLDAAELCSTERVRFALIGRGVLTSRLEAEIARRRIDNVLLIDHQPYSMMPAVHGASDVCLVPLLGEVNGSALPSKVFRIMAWGRPIIAMCDPESELADIVRDSGAGLVVPAGRADLLLEAVGLLAEDDERRQRMASAGRDFVERHYSRDVVTRRYVDLVADLSA